VPIAPSTPGKVKPFRLSQVSLSDGVLRAKRDRMVRYAREFPADRVLANFRVQAGLSTGGALPPGGWDDATGLLRGHYSGHFLSMLAQAAESAGEQALLDKLGYLVGELGRCRDAMAASGRYSHPGYLAAFAEDQFAKLERYVGYPSIWAPWYTCHKLLAGLLDTHRLTGNPRALDLAHGLGRWTQTRLSRTTPAQRRRMWGLYIAGEYGGMNESLAELAVRTGDEAMLSAARYFDNEPLLAACAENRDLLDGKHANQHIPQFLGYLSVFEATGETRYFSAARNFFQMVVPHRMYSHGGVGQAEVFRARDEIAGSIVGATNAETCAAYNLIKLGRRLFQHTGDARYQDYVERALFNQVLGSRADSDSADDPLVTYMLPVAPGSRRRFGNLGTCCGGTGMESFTKLADGIYGASPTDFALYVNLYVPSRLDWSERGITVTQQAPAALGGPTRLVIAGSGTFSVKLRVPHWAGPGFAVRINGQREAIGPATGGYASIDRAWADGDTIDVALPRKLRVERALDDPTLVTIFDGPLALVARHGSTGRLLVGGLDAARHLGPAHHYQLGSLRLTPLYEADDEPYHLYLRDTEPTC
jgi:uncharacterized protein